MKGGSSLKNTTFERSSINNIRLHVLPTNQFKTFAIAVYIGNPLTEDTVTPIALIPHVLRRGTQAYPETKTFREKLDDLYGAGFGFDVLKRGDYQIVQFRMDIIEDRYIDESGPSLLAQAIEFLGSAITEPALENNHFMEKYVEAEKRTVQRKIEAVINDKIRYAEERCMQEMCKDEPYRLFTLGTIEALQPLNAESLYEKYLTWLQQAPIDIYVVGNTSLAEVLEYVTSAIQLKRDLSTSYEMKATSHDVKQVNTVIEKLDIKQGKLNMGLRTHITYADDLYSAMLMYNGILGGYPHSKLFINVREKASLAYYASSRLDGHKGILAIRSGIEMDNYEKASAIIQKQLEAMRQGEITELELSQTKAMLANQLREINDSAFEMISYDFNSVLSGVERSVSELIEAITKIDRQQLTEVAHKVQLDTLYFLRDQKGD
ncbi:MAG: pitrilysin family protein [Paenibacillaceae bacterium]